MERIKGIQELKSPIPASVVTIGNFDGVHRGHQFIIKRAIADARKLGIPCVVFTFQPHPRRFLRPDQAMKLVSPYAERRRLVEKLGPEYLIEEPFSREFSEVLPEQFFQQYLLQALGAKKIVVGYDFGFGKDRKGSRETLEKFCEANSVELEVVSPFKVPEESEIVSSTEIRKALSSGDLKKANAFLGYAYSLSGVVHKGDGRGRTIGFPTANQKPGDHFLLPKGVYATRTHLDDEVFRSVTNVGVRPTFESEVPQLLVETHLIGKTLDLYGLEIRVEFLLRLREEKKFGGVEELKAQIQKDVESAGKISTAPSSL